MARGVNWHGANFELARPKGQDEQQCNSLYVFRNGHDCVSCWELTPDEIAEIVRTGKVFVVISYGWSQPPIYIGLEEDCRQLTADHGTWKKEP